MKSYWLTDVPVPRYLFWPLIILLLLQSVLSVARFFAG